MPPLPDGQPTVQDAAPWRAGTPDRRELLKAALATGALAGSGTLRAAAPPAYAVDTLTPASDITRFGPVFDAGMTGSVLSVAGPPPAPDEAAALLRRWNAMAGAASRFHIVRTADDFRVAYDAQRFAAVLHCQYPSIIEQSGDTEEARFGRLGILHGLGLRGLQLTYNDRNSIGGGYWEDTTVPLSLYGRRLVNELNRLRMLVDVSHSDDTTTREAIRVSRRPAIVSHAGCRALFDNPRNKPDDVLRALARHGGYFGVFNMTLWMTASGTSSVATVVDHIQHAIDVGGIELVGFGSDHPVDGESRPNDWWSKAMAGWVEANARLGRRVGVPPSGDVYAADLNGPDRLLRIRDEMRRRGIGHADIDKVLGLNFIRVFRDVCG